MVRRWIRDEPRGSAGRRVGRGAANWKLAAADIYMAPSSLTSSRALRKRERVMNGGVRSEIGGKTSTRPVRMRGTKKWHKAGLQQLIEQRGQYAERFQTDERINRKAHVGCACGAVEHPGRNLKRPPDIRAVQRAAEDAARLIDRAVNENVVPEAGMKSIQKLPADRPVGVPKPCCSTNSVRIRENGALERRRCRPSLTRCPWRAKKQVRFRSSSQGPLPDHRPASSPVRQIE